MIYVEELRKGQGSGKDGDHALLMRDLFKQKSFIIAIYGRKVPTIISNCKHIQSRRKHIIRHLYPKFNVRAQVSIKTFSFQFRV